MGGDTREISQQWKVVSVRDTRLDQSQQSQLLATAINRKNSGARKLSAGSVLMPPAKVTKAHRHNTHELIVVVIEGNCATLMGPELKPVIHKAGDFVYIPSGVIHAAVNLSTTDRAVAIEMRTDPEFNEDVELVPDLDARAQVVAAELREQYLNRDSHDNFVDLL